MSLGKNLQFLRKIHNGMTQEELAEQLNVSRQTVSKWELDDCCPELDKLCELCKLFSCSLDRLVREDMNTLTDAYSDMRVVTLEPLRYVLYTVISSEPEDDALYKMQQIAAAHGETEPEIVGWDFPFLTQEQQSVYRLRGYTVAWILKEGFTPEGLPVMEQKAQKYAAITIKQPETAPFVLIPNGFKTLSSYVEVNGLKYVNHHNCIESFEKLYKKDGVEYMDIYEALS